MSYYGWKPYVPVAERRKKAEKIAAKAKKSGLDFAPIESFRGAIARTFWGKAWCENLEAYSDYANRLPRGRTYVRNGSVIDFRIQAGEVHSQVMGSSLYKVIVKVAAVLPKQWQDIGKACAGSIDSLVELLQGKLSSAVMQHICTPRTGLFPAPREISFNCSCPDGAYMCKHIAAVLYGVGARLDQQPDLLFKLRQVDAQDLVSQAGQGLPKRAPAAGRVLDDTLLGDVFGIEMDETRPPLKGLSSLAKPAPIKVTTKSKAAHGLPPATGTKSSATPSPRKASAGGKPWVEKTPARAIARIKDRMAELGLTLEDISNAAQNAPRYTGTDGAKVRDPASGATWSGRGRTPAWIMAAEAAGRSRNEFAIR